MIFTNKSVKLIKSNVVIKLYLLLSDAVMLQNQTKTCLDWMQGDQKVPERYEYHYKTT